MEHNASFNLHIIILNLIKLFQILEQKIIFKKQLKKIYKTKHALFGPMLCRITYKIALSV